MRVFGMESFDLGDALRWTKKKSELNATNGITKTMHRACQATGLSSEILFFCPVR